MTPRLSDRALVAVVFAAAIVVIVAVLVADLLTAPILPASEPMTTGTAAPIPPSGPVELTAIPMHLRGPR